MSQIVTCPPSGCKTIVNSACAFYYGPSLIGTGIATNDSVEVIIQKIDQYLMNNVGGGPGDNETILKKDVFKIAHGFSVGEAIRNTNGVWVKAQANILANSGSIGIVCDVFDTNNFSYQWGGHMDVGGPWEVGKSYFLSTQVAGGVVLEEQYSAGQVREFLGTGTEHGLLIEIDLGDLYSTSVNGGGGDINLNIVTDYRSSFESSDGKLYVGYILNNNIVITRTLDGVLENAINLTNLEADWINRLNLIYN